jgi:phospholipase/carboxylesterase
MSDLPRLSGPARDPAAGGYPKRLVILVHGYGANGDDLIGLAPALADAAPDAKFLAPDAPDALPMVPNGRQWFPLTDFSLEERVKGVAYAGPILDAYISEQLAEHGLSERDLVLIGFSQGTMTALHVALRRAAPVAGVVGFSGMLIGRDTLADAIKSRPPVMLVHGDADQVLPIQCLPDAYEGLKENGVRVAAHVRPGLGHGIDDAGIAVANAFLLGAFGR